MNLQIGDWVTFDIGEGLGQGTGWIEYFDDTWDTDDPDVVIVMVVNNEMLSKTYYNGDVRKASLYENKDILLDLALGLRDFKWCEEIAKEIKK